MGKEISLIDAIVKRIKKLCNTYHGGKIAPYEVAKNAKFNSRTLSHILSGYCKNPKISTIKKICEGLNVSLYEFFNDDMFK